MTLKQIEYVLAVAKFQSFSAASKSLFISQPSISEQIINLENELGVQLFYRDRKGATLTPIGKQFVLEGGELIRQFNKFSENFKNYCDLIQGSIHIGLYWAFGYTEIPSKLSLFLNSYPNVKADYIIDGSINLMKRTQRKEIDVAFVTGFDNSFENMDIENVYIGSSPLIALMHRDHPLAINEKIHFRDLSNQVLLNLSKKSNLFNEFNINLNKYTKNPIFIGESSQMDAAHQIATNNLGISFISEEVAKTLNDENIKILPLIPQIYRNVYLIYHQEIKNNLPINELIRIFSNS